MIGPAGVTCLFPNWTDFIRAFSWSMRGHQCWLTVALEDGPVALAEPGELTSGRKKTVQFPTLSASNILIPQVITGWHAPRGVLETSEDGGVASPFPPILRQTHLQPQLLKGNGGLSGSSSRCIISIRAWAFGSCTSTVEPTPKAAPTSCEDVLKS